MGMIEIHGLRKLYKADNRECLALNNINLTIDKGDFVAICGTSGSGKTTLFNILSGIDTDYEGSCIIDKKDNKSISREQLTIRRRNKIGIVFQFFNLIETLTVEENISLSVELDGKNVDQSKLEKIMKELEILEKRNAFID